MLCLHRCMKRKIEFLIIFEEEEIFFKFSFFLNSDLCPLISSPPTPGSSQSRRILPELVDSAGQGLTSSKLSSETCLPIKKNAWARAMQVLAVVTALRRYSSSVGATSPQRKLLASKRNDSHVYPLYTTTSQVFYIKWLRKYKRICYCFS